MNDAPLSLRDTLSRVAVPLAALAAMAALAWREVDPVSGAESWYLAVLATGVLLAASFLARAPAWETGLGSMLAAAAVWALPAGPGRGAVVVALLLGVLAVAAGRRLALLPTPPPQLATEEDPDLPDLFDLPLGVTIPLALGLQVLLRGGELLFRPEANVRTLVALLVLPVMGAAATSLLAQRHGSRALIAAGVVVMLAPGWNVAATLGLVVLAAADLANQPHLGRITRVLAALVVLAPIAWEPLPGVATAVAALTFVRPRQAWVLLLAFGTGLALISLTSNPALLSIDTLPFLLMPGLIFAGHRLGGAIAGVTLAMAVPLVPDLSAMAGPLAVAALCMASFSRADHPAGREGRSIQGVWTAVLLGATTLLASYPWLRAEPVRDALALFGLRQDLDDTVFFAVVGLAFLALLARLRHVPLSPAVIAAGALLVVAWIHLPATGTLLVPEDTAIVVDAARPRWQAPLDGQQVRALVVESSLSNGASLDNETAIATVRLRGEGDRTVAWVLRAGVETGEWAARRPDVAASSVLESPPAWISWVAGDFFGQRYRVRWVPERESFSSPLAGPFTELTVERNPGLPAEVSLAIHRIEVRH